MGGGGVNYSERGEKISIPFHIMLYFSDFHLLLIRLDFTLPVYKSVLFETHTSCFTGVIHLCLSRVRLSLFTKWSSSFSVLSFCPYPSVSNSHPLLACLPDFGTFVSVALKAGLVHAVLPPSPTGLQPNKPASAPAKLLYRATRAQTERLLQAVAEPGVRRFAPAHLHFSEQEWLMYTKTFSAALLPELRLNFSIRHSNQEVPGT
jgi:hypothetical protein